MLQVTLAIARRQITPVSSTTFNHGNNTALRMKYLPNKSTLNFEDFKQFPVK